MEVKSPLKVRRGTFTTREKTKAKTKRKNRLNNCGERAHHNALEKRRRQRIRLSFENLRDSVPSEFQRADKSSRSEILRNATEYIQYMKQTNFAHFRDIQRLHFENQLLERELQTLKTSGTPQEESRFGDSEYESVTEQDLRFLGSTLPGDTFSESVLLFGLGNTELPISDSWTSGHTLQENPAEENIAFGNRLEGHGFVQGSHTSMQYIKYANDAEEIIDVETLFSDGL